jgi:hypothetical protein
MTRGFTLTAFFVCAGLSLTSPAHAQETPATGDSTSTLGLDPTAPQVAAPPGGMTPAYGQQSATTSDWRFDFHGFLTAPLRVGINTRENATGDQSEIVLHAPPVVPDDLETFSHTGVVPKPFVQLNFSIGNSIVTGNVSILARQQNAASGFFDVPAQRGINDVFLAIVPQLGERLRLDIRVGAFSNRYGVTGEYDEGRYGTPLIARTNGAGENIAARLRLGDDFTLLLEQGIQGQSDKAQSGIIPDNSNDFADPNVGTGFVNHFHAGLGYRNWGTLGAHYMTAWSQDERATGTLAPDGRINILAADLRLTLGRFGHFYTAVSHTDAEHARTVGRIVEVLNTRGGPGLIENYLGEASGGNGSLLTIGAQYDLSIGRLVSYPVPFSGDGPDVFVSAFGMQTLVQSDDPAFDDVTKYKWGVEATYSLLSWLAASARYDQVVPNADEQRYSFAVVSPRVIFRTDWQATNQVVLQYSHWFNGSLTTVRTGYPPREDVTAIPDEDMVSLSASMWW